MKTHKGKYQMADRARVMNTKIALKDVGNPKLISTLPETENRLLLGSILGITNGIKSGTGADGVTPVFGLKGNFEAIPSDASKPVVASGVGYLPEAFMQPIIDALSDEVDDKGEVTKDGADSIQFAFNVYVIKAANPQGYSWQLEPLVKPTENDPLSAMRSLLPAPVAQAAIEGGKTK